MTIKFLLNYFCERYISVVSCDEKPVVTLRKSLEVPINIKYLK